ncbi:MAG TPA: undecaprenyl-diphosphate phosphatase [Blastocatellia bacterium]|nr:undecaprenyl-diphosphate phosphatase [Blastocatellia bacterium]
MNIIQIIILAIIQGAAELLPISSSAHVIVAEKLMGLDPASPEMTFLLVMLHTGTMFAVIIYFRDRWGHWLGELKAIVIATICTGIVGLGLQAVIERVVLRHQTHRDVEQLFGNLPLIACSLAAVGILIVIAGSREERRGISREVGTKNASLIGIIQGICLPFRGFSRSGATISSAMLLNVSRYRAEEFSFALAVVLTPAVIAREAYRLVKLYPSASASASASFHLFLPGLLGMGFSFLAGLGALRWLSSWLEQGRWRFFGFYCLIAASAVFAFSRFVP